MRRVEHTPRKRWCAGTMVMNETRGEGVLFAIQDKIDVTLAIDRDVFPSVPRDWCITDAHEDHCKKTRPRMSKFYELKTVSSHRILGADHSGMCVMQKVQVESPSISQH
jgi:hypothetical protein